MVRYASPAFTLFLPSTASMVKQSAGSAPDNAADFDLEHIAPDLRIDARAGIANRQRPLDAEDNVLAGKVERADGDCEVVPARGEHIAVAVQRHLDGVRARVADGSRDLRAVFAGDA